MKLPDTFFVLLADDDKDDRFFFKEALKETGRTIALETIVNGEELMIYLSGTDAVLPHMLFLDLNMPRKGGLECLKEIRRDEKFKDVIVAIYSTSSSEKDIEESFLNGANVYIRKPNDYPSLIRLLEKVLDPERISSYAKLVRENFVLEV